MSVVESIHGEYGRYKAMAEKVFSQLSPEQLSERPTGEGNSIATLVWHISGNLKSRFTNFLTSDGEKPWRRREEEFSPREGGKAELLKEWEEGWAVLFDALSTLDDAQLEQKVSIRGRELRVVEALHRSLAHVAYHVGQMVSFGRMMRGTEWEFITIPPGGSVVYNRAPDLEKPSELR
ncbi:MAG TPA: DinB family protein [Longimicrobiales bacterium]|nr:DinB family protein [Longimicrobiales bacterium]